MLTAAGQRALSIGLGADRVLISANAISEEAYLTALATSLGTSYARLDHVTRGQCPLDDAKLIQASTTGLLDVRSRQWAVKLAGRLGLPADLLPTLREPGELLGVVRADVAGDCGVGDVPVFTVGSHDTASAVLGVPAQDHRFAYISCGTWSLVGVELTAPVTTAAARAAGFGNELGVGGTVRFLRNVMGGLFGRPPMHREL